jgi:drug/metabolite transporter (DMT)-like permease
VLAVAYSVVPFTLFAWAEQHITSALTSVLNACTPMFTATFAVFLLRERLRPVQVGGLLVAFAGVGLLSGVGGSDLASSSVLGVLLAVAATACYGFSFCYVRRTLRDLPPIVITTGQLLVATGLSVPLAGAQVASRGLRVSAVAVLSLLLLGAFGTGIGYLLNYQVIAELGATTASLVTFLIPIVGVAVGVVVLGEPFSFRLVAGAAIVLAGVAMIQWRALRSGRAASRRVVLAAPPEAGATQA